MSLPPYPTPSPGSSGSMPGAEPFPNNPYADVGTQSLADDNVPVSSPSPDRRSLPLRTWLVVIIVLVSGLGLSISSVAVSSIMREVMFSRVDEDLVNSLGGWARNEAIFNSDRSSRPPSDFVVWKIFEDGSSVVFNDPGELPALSRVTMGGPPQTIESGNGASWRVISHQDQGVSTVVAKSLDREHTLLVGLGLIQVVISLLVLAVMALLGYYFIQRAMAPLREVERTARTIAAGNLDRRVPQWSRDTEVGQLAFALNKMLGQLQDSVESAQDKEEQMRRFVGDASHELRTPLTSVRGYTELYRSGATDNVDMVFSKIDDESRRMSLLVEDLLALTRAEGARLEKRTVDILELALSVAGSARAAFPGRTVEVANKTFSIPVVEGDPSRLHQVLLNLISNGLNHGGPDASVKVTLEYDADDVVITVADDGRGMAPDVASHIFERFYREDVSRSRASGGSGLGLAIAKSLVEAHQGSISVESTPGEGTAFKLLLPSSEEADRDR